MPDAVCFTLGLSLSGLSLSDTAIVLMVLSLPDAVALSLPDARFTLGLS
eukprot:CAMPEP_0172581054 /NCGR_PEP_ID=MMETSP1068-20121228/144_1 /TAXON_ID=35684 /ORGANISM="Pseudopedinella elastica, Strain CCMP716" /LENGTH=48 /DNA_ID= /DNA_START= /DNA_END= /DNA_ORIENTATION=